MSLRMSLANVAHPTHSYEKKAVHTHGVLLLGMVIVNKKAIKDPKVHFRGKEIY